MALPAGIKVSHKTSSALVFTGNCKLWGWSIKATGANAEATLWDNTSAAPTTIEIMGAATDNDSARTMLAKPLDVATGLYLTLANCVGSVYYEEPV